MAVGWPFADPENLAVFTLKRIVRSESPILMASHDEDDGGWQSLDGDEAAIDEASLVCPRTITEIDPSVLELADLPLGWVARRVAPGSPWERDPAASEEDRERKLVSDVEEFGWHVILIPEDDEGPAFAYSVGLSRTFGHPEIVVLGLDLDVMHRMVNLIGEEVRQGRRFADSEIRSGILEGYEVRFLDVARRHYTERFGYARWYYQGDDFPVLQCFWPDRQKRFPTEPGFSESLRPLQPLLVPKLGGHDHRIAGGQDTREPSPPNSKSFSGDMYVKNEGRIYFEAQVDETIPLCPGR